MSTPATLSDQDARTQRHLEFLDILIAQGVDIATRLHQQSTTPSDLCSALAKPGIAIPFMTRDVIDSFDQISRAVRRAILVSRKLAEPLPLARSAPGTDAAARTRPVHDVEDHIQSGTQPAPTEHPAERPRVETVRSEYVRYPQSPDLEDRIGARPLTEIIAGLCRELGMDRNCAPSHSEPPTIAQPETKSTRAAEPRPPKRQPKAAAPPSPSPTLSPKHPELPADPAEAVAKLLHLARIRDG